MRTYTTQDPRYDDVRCVYIALPGAMGEEETAAVVSVGDHGAEWTSFDLFKESDYERLCQVFPPFKEFGYDLAWGESEVDGWKLIYLSTGHSLLVHDSIYERLGMYKWYCRTPRARARGHTFGSLWARLIEGILSEPFLRKENTKRERIK